MKKSNPYLSIASSLIMIIALIWMTVSTPFIYAADKMVTTEVEKNTGDTDDSTALTGATEEKSESSTNTLSEYLNDLLHEFRPFTSVVKVFKCHSSDIYLAFRPELISPPPDHKI